MTEAVVREVDGQLVLDDPDALAMIKAVEKFNCIHTFTLNKDRIEHFKGRVVALNLTLDSILILVANVDTDLGQLLADRLMPGFNWEAIRDQGQVPFARGMAGRDAIQEVLNHFDPEGAAVKLRDMPGLAVVVVDHGVAEVFSADEGVSRPEGP